MFAVDDDGDDDADDDDDMTGVEGRKYHKKYPYHVSLIHPINFDEFD